MTACCSEMSKGELKQTSSDFPIGPKNSSQTKSFSVLTTQHIPPEAMKGPEVQRSLSQPKFREQVKAEKSVIRFPSPLLSWESGRLIANGGEARG